MLLGGTRFPGLTSLRGLWGLSGPGQVGRETLREHSTHNQREEDQSGMHFFFNLRFSIILHSIQMHSVLCFDQPID